MFLFSSQGLSHLVAILLLQTTTVWLAHNTNPTQDKASNLHSTVRWELQKRYLLRLLQPTIPPLSTKVIIARIQQAKSSRKFMSSRRNMLKVEFRFQSQLQSHSINRLTLEISMYRVLYPSQAKGVKANTWWICLNLLKLPLSSMIVIRVQCQTTFLFRKVKVKDLKLI